MNSLHFVLPLFVVAAVVCTSRLSAAEPLPSVSDLPSQTALPDPLVMRNGDKVASPDVWNAKRKPELKELFQHYMYGFLPDAPMNVVSKVERTDEKFLGGKGTLKEVTIKFGPKGTPPINLLLAVPNKRNGAAPVVLGLNFCGNHALLSDASVKLPTGWLPKHCAGVVDNKATDVGRNTQPDNFAFETALDRGYAVATFYHGDIKPDRPEFDDGVYPHYFKPGQTTPGPHEWGTIAAWAWGLSRAADYLVTDKNLDAKRMIVLGHSRNGKTALVAGAFDERFALIIPHQAGCGGTAPSRGKVGESVKQINDRFPHWFCGEFKKFNDEVERLPFDQHELIALCAPRPVLLTNAVEDQWANPDGQFEMLVGADPVYKLLGVEGVGSRDIPATGKLLNSRLGYFIRLGKHSMGKEDWTVFLDFADKQLK